MIAAYPDRRFQVWEYRVSHGSLLVRSPKGSHAEKNVDLVFVGVDYMALPRLMRGVSIDLGTADDHTLLRAEMGDDDQIFVLESDGHRHPVVAKACRVSENDGDIFDSPF